MNTKFQDQKAKLLKEGLANFTGTEEYFTHYLGRITYTEGVKYLADKTESYWLINIVASYQSGEIKKIPFQLWTLTVKDEEGEVTMRNDNDNPVQIRQKIKYTDFPLDVIKLYLINGVLMLPNEY